MRRKILIYMIGILSGIVICLFYSWTNNRDYSYIILPNNYEIGSGMGIIKKGIKLRIDEGFGEGFTRYILYLNIRDSEPTTLDTSKSKYEIKPYWLMPIDTIK